ncbi:MAG TPA: hypothetical protein VHB97_27595 [Polyangia bacterium]|jgi:hypothetical protein|nr:hypothetical protein [Polyangia bacterium]
MIEALRTALSEPDARIVVRTPSAICELPGPLPLRAGDEWLTIGHEGQPHIHLRAVDVHALRFAAPDDGNVAIEVVDAAGARVVRVAFGHTNPGKPECDHARRAVVIARYGDGA